MSLWKFSGFKYYSPSEMLFHEENFKNNGKNALGALKISRIGRRVEYHCHRQQWASGKSPSDRFSLLVIAKSEHYYNRSMSSGVGISGKGFQQLLSRTEWLSTPIGTPVIISLKSSGNATDSTLTGESFAIYLANDSI